MSQPLPLSAQELDFVRRHEATVCCCEKAANHVSPAQAVEWGEPERINEARWLATIAADRARIEALDRKNAALAAKLANIRKLCDEQDEFVAEERTWLNTEREGEIGYGEQSIIDLVDELRLILDAKPGVEET
jgi:hypothetical protein